MTGKLPTETSYYRVIRRPDNQFQPRPRLISAGDFAELADLAWRLDPRRGIAKQISIATGIAESTIDRWLKDDGYPPPPDIIEQALALADKRLADKADLLDRVAKAIITETQTESKP